MIIVNKTHIRKTHMRGNNILCVDRIMESVSKVIFLTFSSDGSQLLVVLSMGRVHLFTKGAALHQWTSSHTCDWDGEDILHINFFHGGIRVGLYFTSCICF